jgi:membrane protease YdiL (CAAX protease family)
MSKSANPAVTMTRREQAWGFVYLLLELLALPLMLNELNKLLPTPLSDSWLNFLYFSLNFIFVCFLFRDFLKRCLIQIGRNLEDFILVTAGGFGFYYLCNGALTFVIRHLAPGFSNLNDGNIAQQASGNFAIMAIGTVVLVPVAEELLHRGLVFGSLYCKNRWLAYGFSAALFSCIHILGYMTVYPLPHLILAFIQYLPAGLVLAWAYRKSGTIFCPILIHAAVNTLALLALR